MYGSNPDRRQPVLRPCFAKGVFLFVGHKISVHFYSLLVAEFSITLEWNGLSQHILSSHSFVGVEHDSNKSTHGVGSDVSLERNSNNTGMTVSVDHFTPGASVTSVVLGVLHFVDIGNALTKIPLGASLILAVFNMNQCLI